MSSALVIVLFQAFLPFLPDRTACLQADVETALAIAKEKERNGVCEVVCSGCRCKGGPGYRNPETNHCVGWGDLNDICGPAPHLKCIAECAEPQCEKTGKTVLAK